MSSSDSSPLLASSIPPLPDPAPDPSQIKLLVDEDEEYSSSSEDEGDEGEGDEGEGDYEGDEGEDEGDSESSAPELSPIDAAIQGDDLPRLQQLFAGLDESQRRELLAQRNQFGAFPLFTASQLGRLEHARFLLEQRADPDMTKENGVGSLFIASQYGQLEVARLLLEHRANANLVRDTGAGPLLIACQYGWMDMARLLLSFSADVNQRKLVDAAGPLFIACQYGHRAMVELLLAEGAVVDQPKTDGATPLFIASQKGHTEIIRMLVAARADVDLARQDGSTPLAFACQKGNLEAAVALIEAGASIASADREGCTPLITAARYARDKIVRLLLEQGADPQQVSGLGLNALGIAILYATPAGRPLQAAQHAIYRQHTAAGGGESAAGSDGPWPRFANLGLNTVAEEQALWCQGGVSAFREWASTPQPQAVSPVRLRTIELLVAVTPPAVIKQTTFAINLPWQAERLIQRRVRHGCQAWRRAVNLVAQAQSKLRSRRLTLRDYRGCLQKYEAANVLSPESSRVAMVRLMRQRVAELHELVRQQQLQAGEIPLPADDGGAEWSDDDEDDEEEDGLGNPAIGQMHGP